MKCTPGPRVRLPVYAPATVGLLILTSLTWTGSLAIAQSTVNTCQSTNSDADGDGWGWEDGASCLVMADTDNGPNRVTTCQLASSDLDGDGWGWENNASCAVADDTPAAVLACADSASDPDGDGWGWENDRSCRAATVTPDTPETPPVDTDIACTDTDSDPDNDGWGWENDRSCMVQITDQDTSDFGTSTAGVLCDYLDITFNSNASVNATSRSEWTCSDTARVLTANGIPDHETGTFPNDGNPNTISEQDVSASLTLTPTSTEIVSELGGPRGTTGFMLNGIKIDAGTGGSCDDTGLVCDPGQNVGSWGIEALTQPYFDFGADQNNAHVQPDGTYHYHGMPEGFITKQGGSSNTMTLVGWAADGFPIYARYGHGVANDASSPLEMVSSSYQLVGTVSSSRPSTDLYALGTFAQDWEYAPGLGDLDECNGRVGVTPEFPGGIYHYFSTDSYPFLQRCVKGTIETSAAGGGERPGNEPPTGAPPAQ